jgi:CMP-N-acetylneuraminic acid synthetase
MKVTALIPIKVNSERVAGKNFRLFNGVPLYTIVLKTLESCSLIDKIIVNTDSPEIKNYIQENLPRTTAIDRPQNLLGDMVVMNTLIEHDIQFSENEHVFQTHCTNPLITEKTIKEAIEQYFNSLDTNDSLLSVTRIQARTYWENGSPINHDLKDMKRTQDLDAVFEENSNFFIFSKTSFKNALNSRIGKRPKLFEINKIEAIDIDYEEDFLLAELIHKNKNLFNSFL